MNAKIKDTPERRPFTCAGDEVCVAVTAAGDPRDKRDGGREKEGVYAAKSKTHCSNAHGTNGYRRKR